MEIIKKNWKIKLLSVFLAIFFWSFVIVSENPIVSARISNIPIVYENIEQLESKGLVVTEDLRPSVEVDISGQRSNIINVTPQHIRVSVDFASVDEGAHLLKLQYSLPEGIKLKESPQTINVNVEKVLSRDFTVSIENNGELPESYLLESTNTTPNKVTIRGARSKLNEINRVIVPLNLSELTTDVILNAEIRAIDAEGNEIDNIIYGQQFVNINANVSKQKEVEIKTNIVGEIGSEYRIENYNLNRTKTYIKGPKNVIDDITEINTHDIDISGIKTSGQIPVKLSLPADINLVNEDFSYMLDVEVSSKITKEYKIPKDKVKVLASDKFNTKINTEDINITLIGFASDLNTISVDSIVLTVDARDKSQGTHTIKPTIKINNKTVSDKDIKNISDINIEITEK